MSYRRIGNSLAGHVGLHQRLNPFNDLQNTVILCSCAANEPNDREVLFYNLHIDPNKSNRIS